MPCYDPRNYEEEEALKKVNQLTALLCEACKTMEHSEQEYDHILITGDLHLWWESHKEDDRARKGRK